MHYSKHKKPLSLIPMSFEEKGVIRNALEQAKNRLLITGIIFILGFLVIGFRLVDVMCFHSNQEQILAENRTIRGLKMGRANITDRNGQIIATSVTTSSLYANPKVILDANDAAEKLSRTLPWVKKKETIEKLNSDKGFVWLARHLTPQQKAEVIQLGIPGIDFMSDQKRIYPYGRLLSHAVGMTDHDGNGISGLERGLDEKLRQDQTLITSIDLRLQNVLHNELGNSIEEFGADGAGGLIMDIENGEVLAMASLPDFDPNKPDITQEKNMFNTITLGAYEMGSTMKIVNTALGLESGVITKEQTFDVSRPIKIGRFTITDFHKEHGVLNYENIFIKSSNIGSAQMAMLVGPERQRAFFKKLGLLDPVKLEIPELGTPLSPSKWREMNTITISYGYGIAFSPMQLCPILGGIATGIKHEPTLIKDNKTNAQRIVSDKTARIVSELMFRAVRESPVGKAKVDGIIIGGKTGTANLRSGKGYQKKNVFTSYFSIFPEKPKYIVFVMIENPKAVIGTHGFNNAGWNATPTAARIISRIAPILGIQPTLQKEENSVLIKPISLKEKQH